VWQWHLTSPSGPDPLMVAGNGSGLRGVLVVGNASSPPAVSARCYLFIYLSFYLNLFVFIFLFLKILLKNVGIRNPEQTKKEKRNMIDQIHK
jgi:hypothetical protein